MAGALEDVYSQILEQALRWQLLGLVAWVLSCVFVTKVWLLGKRPVQSPQPPASPQTSGSVASSPVKKDKAQDVAKQVGPTPPKLMLPLEALHRTVSSAALAGISPSANAMQPSLPLPFLDDKLEVAGPNSRRNTMVSFEDSPEWLYFSADASDEEADSSPVAKPMLPLQMNGSLGSPEGEARMDDSPTRSTTLSLGAMMCRTPRAA